MDSYAALEKRARELSEAREGPFAKIPAEPWDWKVYEPEWLLEKLIPAKSVGMVYGPSNSGKSHLMCDMIAAMVAGEETWQGIPMESGDVVMFSESIGHIQARMKAYLGDREVVNSLYSLPTMSLETAMIDFLAEWIESLPRVPSVVCFDTLSTMFCFEENDNREASQLIKALEQKILPLLSKRGTIIIIHHTSKVSEGKVARGASALIGNIDYSWNVTYDKKSETTLAQFEKDRWRLFRGVNRWVGTMRRVPVMFENGSAEMSVLDWTSYSEEAEQVAEQLQHEQKIANMQRELETMIAEAGARPFFADAGEKGPAGVNWVHWPKDWNTREDIPAMRDWLRDKWATEPVFNRNGRQVGFVVLGRGK